MKIAVVIPTYNERENIKRLISQILKLRFDIKIIVVDDNSPDGTGKIVGDISQKTKAVILVKRKAKLGLGTAYLAGFRKAIKEGVDVVVTMDADFSHNPLTIPKLISEMKNFDVVVGSRYDKGGKVIGFDIFRTHLSSLAQLFCQVLLGLKLKDSTSGFRAYRLKAIKSLLAEKIESDGYSFLIEAAFRLSNKGFSLGEQPIIFKVRRKGKSKLSEIEIFKAMLTVVRLRFHLGNG